MEIDHGRKNFNFIPKSYILPKEFSILIKDSERFRSKIYICKPSQMSRGRGIFLTRDFDEVNAIILP